MPTSHIRDLLARLEKAADAAEVRITTADLEHPPKAGIWDGFIPEPVAPEELAIDLGVDLSLGLRQHTIGSQAAA